MFGNLPTHGRLDQDTTPSTNTRHGWPGAADYVYTTSLQDEDDRYLSVGRMAPRRLLASRYRALLKKLAQALTRRR